MYAFQKDFDPRSIKRVVVGPFVGRPGKTSKIITSLYDSIVYGLTKYKITANVATSASAGEVMTTGAVVSAKSVGEKPTYFKFVAGERVTRDKVSVSIIQLYIIAVD